MASIWSCGELDRLLRRLRTLHRHRHAAGRDLELDRELADAVQRRTVVGALQVETVAGGAVGLEELLAVFDGERGRHLRLGGRGHRGGCAGVDAAGDQQADADEGGCGPGTATTVRAARGRACHVGNQLRSISGSR